LQQGQQLHAKHARQNQRATGQPCSVEPVAHQQVAKSGGKHGFGRQQKGRASRSATRPISSTAQLRLKAPEDAGVITNYTIGVGQMRAANAIRAMVLISMQSQNEPDVVRALARRHEITKLYSVSGRYDLCAMLMTESTQELDAVLDKIRQIKGVVDTFSTLLLSTKLDRPE